MLPLALAALLCIVLHVVSFACAARWAGVPVREVSIGYGPVLLGAGTLRLRLLPLGGFARLKDTRSEQLAPADTADAFDRQPAIVRVLITLSGCFSLLCLVPALGGQALDALLSGFAQFFSGALSPMGEAQALLAAGQDFAHGASFAATCGLVAAKLAAVNLLPFPSTNGGQAIAVLLERFGTLPQGLVTATALAFMGLIALWVWAGLHFVARACC